MFTSCPRAVGLSPGAPAKKIWIISRCSRVSVPMEGRCSVPVAAGESSIRTIFYVSQIWDTGRGQPISPIMASTTFSIYTPAADRILTLTNNLWLLRRAADGQAMGSGFPCRIRRPLYRYASGRAHDHQCLVADDTLRMWQISPEAEPIPEERAKSPTMTETELDRESLDASWLTGGFVTDGRIAITNAKGVSGRERIRVSDLATGRTLGRPSPHYPGWTIRGLALSPDGRFFATGSNPALSQRAR